MAKEKRKRVSGRVQKVWHITDFRKLFELPDDLRKKRTGPLSYTKSFVSLTGKSEAQEISHCERLAELKSRPERHLLRSIFEDLKNFSGKKALAHRGYLVTTAEQPAGYEYLASQLKVDIADLRKAVPVLEQIGLIERISMNGFTGEARPKKAKRRAGKKGKRGKSGTVRNNPERSGIVRNNPDVSGKRRKTLKKRKGNQSNDKTNSNEHKATKHNGSDKSNGLKNCRQRGGVNANALESKQKPANNESPSMSSKSRDSAAGGRPRLIGFPSSPRAAFDNCEPQAIGDIVGSIKHRYGTDAKQFGCEIYRTLELNFSPTSKRGRRELGCFGSLWEGAKAAGIDASALEDLRVRAIKEAGKIAKRRSRCGNISAVFCYIFGRLLSAARCRAAQTGLEVCG